MSRALATWLLLASFAGCARSAPVEVVTVFSHGNCQRINEGVAFVSVGQLASFRGVELLQLETPPPAEGAPADETPLLVAILRGTRPTAGYTLELAGAPSLEAGVLTVTTRLMAPPPDAILAQVLTHPCLVIRIVAPPFERVRVLDETGELIGEASR